MNTTPQKWPNGVPRTRGRFLSGLVAATLVFVACGGSETADEPTQATQSQTSSETPEASTSSEATASSQPGETSLTSLTVHEVEIPEGVLIFEADNQSLSFGGIGYMVTLQGDGIRLISIDPDGAHQTDAVITGATFGEVWNSGSRLVLSGVDPGGDLVLMSSEDGATFAEDRIPIPARYVEEDVWEATSVMADVAGAADLNGDLYLIARVGVNWAWTNDIVARSAYSVSEELGDAVRFASTIRRSPQGDDWLFTFETSDDEVLYEVLASEAGVEPGYQEAYDARFQSDSTDFGFYGGWVVSEEGVRQTAPPLDGGLDGDLRLNQLYSLGEGVAALVTDWSEDAGVAQPVLSVGTGTFGSGQFVRAYSSFVDNVHHSWDGDVWENVGEPVGFGIWPPPQISYDEKLRLHVMYQYSTDRVQVQESEDGMNWSGLPEPIVLDEPFGDDVQMTFLGGEVTFLDEMEDDPMLRAFKLRRMADGGGVTIDPVPTDVGDLLEFQDEVVLDPIGKPIKSVIPELAGYGGPRPIAPVEPVRAVTGGSTDWIITFPTKYHSH